MIVPKHQTVKRVLLLEGLCFETRVTANEKLEGSVLVNHHRPTALAQQRPLKFLRQGESPVPQLNCSVPSSLHHE
jgi:hypothetical protein